MTQKTYWNVVPNSNVGMARQEVLITEVGLIESNHEKGHPVS